MRRKSILVLIVILLFFGGIAEAQTTKEKQQPSKEQIKKQMLKIVQGFSKVPRSPILRRPDEYGMAYEDVFFPSMDGTVLEGWYIPAKTKSNKLIICNHFSPGNRYGYAGHIDPWKTSGGFEVNFLPKYKALVEAGYNVLAYDLRNLGFSSPGAIGGYNPEFFEYRDVIGSLRYVRSREDTKSVKIPTFVIQVKEEIMTYSSDVQAIYDAIPVQDKKLFWIEETPWRFHGYTYFSEHPGQMIEWYDKHMK